MDRLDDLISVLRRNGILSGGEIKKALGISQPTTSRLVREAGSRVSRFGKSVATRYALTREVVGLGRDTPFELSDGFRDVARRCRATLADLIGTQP